MRAAIIALVLVAFGASARAEKHCNCLAVAGDVSAAIQAEVARADSLYARGDYAGALAIYIKAHAAAPKESVLLYAQAMAKWQLAASADAKALFDKYLAAGGQLAYRERAEAGIADINAGVSATVGTVVGATGAVTGFVGGAADSGLGPIDRPKPKKIARGAGIVLGVIAVAAIAVVGVHAIAAGVKDDVELDAKFDLGLGVTGVAVGISAIYVGGLTATTGAVSGAGTGASGVRCGYTMTF
jgi:hypothetical protein